MSTAAPATSESLSSGAVAAGAQFERTSPTMVPTRAGSAKQRHAPAFGALGRYQEPGSESMAEWFAQVADPTSANRSPVKAAVY